MRPATETNDERYVPTDFSKIRIGVKTLNDAVVSLGQYKRINPRLGDKKNVLRALNTGDINTMRDISNFFYKTSGIYSRLCRYMAYLYKYDWFITPYINGCEGLLDYDSGIGNIDSQAQTKQRKKQFNNFFKVLRYFESFQIKRFCGEVALKVIRNGCYYGYLIPQTNRMSVQQLQPQYCRSRFKVNNRPAIEFHMSYFDDYFSNKQQRDKILNLFPQDFKKGYKLYKDKKLKPLFSGDVEGWYLLDPKRTIKFNINDQDYPAFISVVPAIIDLDAAQELDRKKIQIANLDSEIKKTSEQLIDLRTELFNKRKH